MTYTSAVLDTAAADRIGRYAKGALVAAGVGGRLPTPLEEVTSALHLTEPEDLLDFSDLPAGLITRLRHLSGKVLGAFAVREQIIYIDRTQSQERVRFAWSHELGHAALPWHAGAYYGDDNKTLAPDTRHHLEAEANRFGADLLFQLDEFSSRASGYRTALAVPLHLAGEFATSRHAAIRRYVEDNPKPCALAVLGQYPIHPAGRTSFKVLARIESESFRYRFGPAAACVPATLAIDEPGVGADALAVRSEISIDPVVAGTVALDTTRGLQSFVYEIFTNTYRVFVLFHPPSRGLGRRVGASWTPDSD